MFGGRDQFGIVKLGRKRRKAMSNIRKCILGTSLIIKKTVFTIQTVEKNNF